MKARQFDYVRASDLDSALAALRSHEEAAILAGGQSLMAMMNMRVAAPSCLVDISKVEELHDVAVTDRTLRLGALVRHVDLETDERIAAAAPLLRKAALELAHPAIRNRGTLGGSLSLADPAAELPACAMALDATIEIAGRDGPREIPVLEFFRGAYETALGEGELLAALRVPVAQPNERFAYIKLARRHGDYAQVGLALKAVLDGGTIVSIRPVFFAVQDRPVLARSASDVLQGAVLDDAAAQDRAAAALADDLSPTDQVGCSAAMKAHLANVLLRRALKGLAGGEA